STNGHPRHYRIEGMGIDFDTPVLMKRYIDEIIGIADEPAFEAIGPLAAGSGIFGGLSSGAVVWGVSQYAAAHMKKGDLGVAVLGDSGRAYLSKLEF
ncbi:MAG: hypothetical protein PHW69_01755, partial [Elusimicrobiaceae bacterium]|nr:hypothetical protein [Elusimicrobiaceae bacterium]